MLKSKQYAFRLTADTTMLIAAQIRSFVVPMLVLTMGGTATDAAALAAFNQTISAIFILPGGIIIDKFNRKILLLISQIISIISFILFIFLITTIGYNIVLFYIVSALFSIRFALLGNTSNVMLPQIVTGEELPEALGANQARDNIVGMISSPLAAMLLAVSKVFPFIVAIFANVLGFIATLGLHNDIPKRKVGQHKTQGFRDKVTSTFAEATIGAKMIVSSRLMIYITLLSALLFPFLNGVMTMLLYDITQIYGVIDASLLDTISAASLLGGSLLAGYLAKTCKTGHLIAAAFICLNLGCLGSILAPGLYPKLFFVGLQGLVLPCVNVVVGSLVMQLIQNDALGRFQAFMMLLGFIINIPVQYLVGISYDHLGFTAAALLYLTCAVLVSLISLTKTVRDIPNVKDMDDFISANQIVL